MECTGRLKGVAKDWVTGKWNITYEVDGDIVAGLDQMRDKLLTIVTKVYRKKRSLDANGMYWKLLGELAEATHVSKPAMHNMLLRRYGQLLIIDGQCTILRIPDTDAAYDKALEMSEVHIRPTSQTIDYNGKRDRVYYLLRGSHDYDTKEFSELLSGLIDECKQCGIPTIAPDEFNRLMDAYEKGHHG